MIRTIFIFTLLLILPLQSFAQYDQPNEWQAGRGYDSTYEVNVPAGANWKQKYVFHGNGDSLAVFDIEHQLVRFYQNYPDEEFINRCPHYKKYEMRKDGFVMTEVDHGIESGAYHSLSEKEEAIGRIEQNFPSGLWTIHNLEKKTTRYIYYYNQNLYSVGYLVILLITFVCLIFAGFILIKAGRYPDFFIATGILTAILILFRIAMGITNLNIEDETEKSLTGDFILVFWDLTPYLFYLVFILAFVNLFRTKKYPSIKIVSIVAVSLIAVLQLLYLATLLIQGIGKIGG